MKMAILRNLILLLLLASPLYGAIAVDVADGGACAGGTSCTKSLTVGNNANRVLVASANVDDTDAITGCTFNTAAMNTDISIDGTAVYVLIASKVAPDTGAHDLVCSYAGFAVSDVYYLSIYNAAQENSEDECSAEDAQTCTIATVSSGSMVYGVWGADRAADPCVSSNDAGQTVIGTQVCTGHESIATYELNDGVPAYVDGTGETAIAAASYKVVAAAPATRRVMVIS